MPKVEISKSLENLQAQVILAKERNDTKLVLRIMEVIKRLENEKKKNK